MSNNKYPNTGRMFPNGYKKNPKHPDYKGEIVMERSTLRQLLSENDGSDDIPIKIAAWDMQGAKGPWIRLSWDNYKPSGNVTTQRSGNVTTRHQQQSINDDESDIPF